MSIFLPLRQIAFVFGIGLYPVTEDQADAMVWSSTLDSIDLT
jgi:hypothetical protein